MNKYRRILRVSNLGAFTSIYMYIHLLHKITHSGIPQHTP